MLLAAPALRCRYTLHFQRDLKRRKTPSSKRSSATMKLIFLYGLPGVGKLTVACELETLTGFRVFHNHLAVDLLESVFEFGSQPFVELREMIWLAVFSQAAESKLAGLIFTFAFDR